MTEMDVPLPDSLRALTGVLLRASSVTRLSIFAKKLRRTRGFASPDYSGFAFIGVRPEFYCASKPTCRFLSIRFIHSIAATMACRIS